MTEVLYDYITKQLLISKARGADEQTRMRMQNMRPVSEAPTQVIDIRYNTFNTRLTQLITTSTNQEAYVHHSSKHRGDRLGKKASCSLEIILKVFEIILGIRKNHRRPE